MGGLLRHGPYGLAGAEDNLAGQFEEHRVLDRVLEIRGHGDLAVITQLREIVTLHGVNHRLGKFHGARRQEGHFGYGTDIERYLGNDKVVRLPSSAARQGRGARRLKMEHHIHVRPGVQDARVETDLRRRLQPVERRCIRDPADGRIAGNDIAQPRSAGLDQHARLVNAPGHIAAAAADKLIRGNPTASRRKLPKFLLRYGFHRNAWWYSTTTLSRPSETAHFGTG